jgi:hypothetical protein
MPRSIDLIRASKLPSNMMQFAAKGALQVPPDENIEILVYLAKHNKIFGEVARLTLAGWDEKASLAAAADPKTPREVLDYFISPENLRPKLLPALLENPSVSTGEITKFAISASQESIEAMLRSPRVRAAAGVLDALRSNPYLKANEMYALAELLGPGAQEPPSPVAGDDAQVEEAVVATSPEPVEESVPAAIDETSEVPEEAVSAYLAEHATEIAAEPDKPFQPVGGIVDLLGADYFPVSEIKEMTEIAGPAETAATGSGGGKAVAAARSKPVLIVKPQVGRRDNSVQKINRLDVKGRIQLALKGNKEERSILIRDGTKVVALAVLDAPKLTDGEVEKFALQKNVLESVLRYIPLKRRFMKNYIVVRNLVSNPRTPLDLGLGLMKHLQPPDLKNLSANKEISETVRKLAMKMYKQKLDAGKKK